MGFLLKEGVLDNQNHSGGGGLNNGSRKKKKKCGMVYLNLIYAIKSIVYSNSINFAVTFVRNIRSLLITAIYFGMNNNSNLC